MVGRQEDFDIVAIPNKYKDTFDNLIDSSDQESLNWTELMDGRFCYASRSEGSSAIFSERDYLNKNVPDRSSQLAPKTRDLQKRQRHVVIP